MRVIPRVRRQAALLRRTPRAALRSAQTPMRGVSNEASETAGRLQRRAPGGGGAADVTSQSQTAVYTVRYPNNSGYSLNWLAVLLGSMGIAQVSAFVVCRITETWARRSARRRSVMPPCVVVPRLIPKCIQ